MGPLLVNIHIVGVVCLSWAASIICYQFQDFPDDSRTGWMKTPKCWENTSPKSELSFYMNADEWYQTWNSRDSGLIVDYVKVYSV